MSEPKVTRIDIMFLTAIALLVVAFGILLGMWVNNV
jgi:hypothetical protein